MEASIRRLADSDLQHTFVSASSPQAAIGLLDADASCWPGLGGAAGNLLVGNWPLNGGGLDLRYSN